MSGWSQTGYGARAAPAASGVIAGGSSGAASYGLTASSAGTGFILSQQLNGLTIGVKYNFSYKYFHTASPASSINCAIHSVGMTSQSGTGDRNNVNSWRSGPDFVTTFVAKATSGLLECLFVANSAQSFRLDDIYLGC
jgi:hypothetical protein